MAAASARTIISQAASEVAAAAAEGRRAHLDCHEIIGAVIESIATVSVAAHPLGFFHFELTPLVAGTSRVRLHVWSSESAKHRDDLGLIHEHTWELASSVLVGRLDDVVLAAEQANNGQYTCARLDYRTNELHQAPGKFNVHARLRRSMGPGETYQLPAGTLHLTEVMTVPTVTLVVAKETSRTSVRIFTRGSLPQSRETIRPPVPDELALGELASTVEGRTPRPSPS
jgi:hypothetical protein